MAKKLVKKERKIQRCQMGNILSTYAGQIGNITDYNSLIANNPSTLWLYNQPQGIATPEQLKGKYANAFNTKPISNPYNNGNISTLTRSISRQNITDPITTTVSESSMKTSGKSANDAISSISSSGGLTKLIGGQGNAGGPSGGGGGISGVLGNLSSNGIGSAGINLFNSLGLGHRNDNEMDNTRNAIFSTGMDIASKMGPWGLAAAGTMTLVNATGGFTDTTKGLGGGNDALNMVASLALPGAGWFTKKLDNYRVSDTLGSSTGYTGTANANEKVETGIAGRKVLFGRGKAKRMIREAQEQDKLASGIVNKGKDDLLASTNVQQMAVADNLNKNASDWMYRLRAGKQGMKFEEGKRLAKLYKKKERPGLAGNQLKTGTDSINAFKEGGIIKNQDGGSVNIIPAGELHARKHDLVEKNPDLEGITKKGIPVIAMDGGELNQSAEIERDEIIFSLETTKKLEELRKKYKSAESQSEKDEIAIAAGILLESEIIENTIDNTGLLKEVK